MKFLGEGTGKEKALEGVDPSSPAKRAGAALASCCSSEAPRLVAGREIGRSAPEPAVVFGV